MFYGILAALAAVIVGLDQWTKWLTVTHIPSTNGSAVVRAIPGFFHITHIKNTGAAWSMLEGQTCRLPRRLYRENAGGCC